MVYIIFYIKLEVGLYLFVGYLQVVFLKECQV